MKSFKTIYTYLVSISLILISLSSSAQQSAYFDNVSSLDKTLESLYAVISGEKGEERDWDLFRYLFHKDAKLIPARKLESGVYQAGFMTPDQYVTNAGKWLVENGFFEKEIHRTVDTFGSITQVFSTYESYRSATDEKPYVRGINSIQLMYDGNRWWIINIYWTSETPDNPIPEEYLPKQ
ncbi:MAG: hypothetical protein ABFS32_09925 [Bacteroidota bacterium]